MSTQRVLPIADHGLIGDLRTAALVGADGNISWFCCPRFDSPSVFASLLDPEVGGGWRIAPEDDDEDDRASQQFYFPDTNILVTRFLTERGVIELHDFMPVVRAHDPDHRQRLVRRVVGVRGTTALRMTLSARPDYARERPTTHEVDGGVLITSDSIRLGLSATVALDCADGDVTAEIEVSSGESALFVLEVLAGDASGGDDFSPCSLSDTDGLFDATVSFWRGWLAQSTYTGRWREMVQRSALTLKLLTHEPSGAIVAAPTASLPEEIGGGRNWDYRYVWIRDAAFSLYALLRMGFTDEARAFMRWLSERFGEAVGDDREAGPLRVMYDIDGRTDLHELTLDHLAGYRGSSPVRIGNAAVQQLQLDIYGELIDSVYLFNKYGPGISHDAWRDLTRVVAWLGKNWDRTDLGMWEIRAAKRDHTTSRLMAWVAIERMIRMARQRGLPGDVPQWSRIRDEIYHQIMDRGWDTEQNTFVQAYGSEEVDAGLLLMPMVKFVSPVDPRFLGTLAAIEQRLVSDSLVFRYDGEAGGDGVDGIEGTFSLCSFWYVEALTRVGRYDDARLALEKMFTYANHLGLYAEEVGLTGEQLGNFPQAFTHLALISAAINLDHKLG